MTLKDWIDLIIAGLKFPDSLMAFVKMLKKTPIENHSDLVAKSQREAEIFQKTGRPAWD